jgi:hypothetical protein
MTSEATGQIIYYNDPLAAWMQTHFQLRLFDAVGREIHWVDRGYYTWAYSSDEQYTGKRFFLDPAQWAAFQEQKVPYRSYVGAGAETVLFWRMGFLVHQPIIEDDDEEEPFRYQAGRIHRD